MSEVKKLKQTATVFLQDSTTFLLLPPNPDPRNPPSLSIEAEEKNAGGGMANKPTTTSPPSPSKRIAPAAARDYHHSNKPADAVPNISHCHRCGARRLPWFPLRFLPSNWRIVPLCSGCLDAINSADSCSYCFSKLRARTDSGRRDDSFGCLHCTRRVHSACVPMHHRGTPPSRDSFDCIDCRPYVRPRGSTAAMPPLKDKAVAAVSTKETEAKTGETDEEVALQLHPVLNSSQMVSTGLGTWSGRDSRLDAAAREEQGGCSLEAESSCGEDIGIGLASVSDGRLCGRSAGQAERVTDPGRYLIKYSRKTQRLRKSDVCVTDPGRYLIKYSRRTQRLKKSDA